MSANNKTLIEQVMESNAPWSLPQVARLLGCSTSYIHILIQKHGMPGMQLSERKIIFEPTKLAAWLRSRESK